MIWAGFDSLQRMLALLTWKNPTNSLGKRWTHPKCKLFFNGVFHPQQSAWLMGVSPDFEWFLSTEMKSLDLAPHIDLKHHLAPNTWCMLIQFFTGFLMALSDPSVKLRTGNGFLIAFSLFLTSFLSLFPWYFCHYYFMRWNCHGLFKRVQKGFAHSLRSLSLFVVLFLLLRVNKESDMLTNMF